MDEIDRKIIEVLQKDSRGSYKEIAMEVKISDVAVHKRIKKLAKGVIKRFTILVDQKEFGRPTTAILMIRCEIGKTPEIADLLSKVDEISEVYTTVGEYDIIAKVHTKDTEGLRRLVENNLRMIRGLNEIRTSIAFTGVKEELSLVM